MLKSTVTLRVSILAACCSIVMALTPVSAQQKKYTKTHSQQRNAESKPMTQPPIACNIFGLNPSERQRQQELRKQLFSETSKVQELSNGYAIGLSATKENILAAAEFISLERLCCSFFQFELAVGKTDEPLWLRITGRDGVKEFLKTELMSK